MKINTRHLGLLFAVLAAVTYGFNSLFGKPALDAGLSVASLTFWRYGFGASLVIGMLLLKGGSLKLTGCQMVFAIVNGFMMSISSLTLFEAFRVMDVGLASTLLFTYPVMTAVIMTTFFKERNGLAVYGAIVLAMLGVFALNGFGGEGGHLPLRGLLLCLASGLSYAVYLVNVRVSPLKSATSGAQTFWVLVWGLPILGIYACCAGGFQLPQTPFVWGCAFGLGFFTTFLSLIFTALAIQRVGATPTAILGALEPVTAITIGVMLFDEKLTFNLFLGMVFIILGTLLVIMKSARQG